MISITQKTLQDLEFETILETIASRCNTDIGETKALAITPFKDKSQLLINLQQTAEYLSSFSNNNVIPNHGFESINYELKFLAIEDSFLEVASFKKISNLTETAITLIQFLKKFETYYPNLYQRTDSIECVKLIIQRIDEVIDKFGIIKDNASPDLIDIRRSINVVRGKINQSFGMALSQYNTLGYLDDIKETVVENRRVLAVLAMYRRKVKGSILGTSKTKHRIY